jgi:hypothetical protein
MAGHCGRADLVLNILVHSDTGIVGSNPSRGMGVYLVFPVFVVSCVQVEALRMLIPLPGSSRFCL